MQHHNLCINDCGLSFGIFNFKTILDLLISYYIYVLLHLYVVCTARGTTVCVVYSLYNIVLVLFDPQLVVSVCVHIILL